MNDAQKLDLFVDTAKAFNKEYPRLILKIMMKAMDDMTLAELEFAIEKAIRKNPWMPAIAKLWEIVNKKRTDKKQKIVQKVTTWLMKNTNWDYSKQAVQEDIDNALKQLGLVAGSIKASDI